MFIQGISFLHTEFNLKSFQREEVTNKHTNPPTQLAFIKLV